MATDAKASAEAAPAKRTSAEAAKGLIAMGGKAPDMQDIPRRRSEPDEKHSAIYEMERIQEARVKHAAEGAKLDAEAAAVRTKYIDAVLVQLRDAGITPAELLTRYESTTKAKASGTRKTKSELPAKYRNDAGQTWTGFGKRPQWLVAALSTGKTLEDFRIK